MTPFWFAGRWCRKDWGSILSRLGKVPDTHLAAEIGAHVKGVQRLRRKLGIARYDRAKQIEPYLGRISDARLARHFGVARETVARRRRKLGIPPCNVAQANADMLLREYMRRLRGD